MANTNPGGLNFNTSPYFDDFDEDKKFARILYVPGRAVQARELTQMQSLQQKQVERFANYFFNQGSVVDGCEQNLDLDLRFVKLDSNYAGSEVNVNNFLNKEIIGANTGIKAFVGLVSDLEDNDPKTLHLNYLTTGAVVLTCNTVSTSLTVGNTVFFDSGTSNTAVANTGTIRAFDASRNRIYVGNIQGGVVTTGTANTILSTGSASVINITGVDDKRANTTFANSETIFTANTTGRAFANATSDAVRHVSNAGLSTETVSTKGSKFTIGSGTMWIADHFVKNSNSSIILDKYENSPSYKIGLVPTKSFVDSIADSSLLDNAQGTSNFQAPGADRFKIDLSLTKLVLGANTDESEFITLNVVENGISQKRASTGLDSKLEEVVAKRTFEESGNYTLSDPKVNVREHLLQGNNKGRFSTADGGNNDLLLLEVDPFVAYVNGFRNEFISKRNVNLTKGLDTKHVEQSKTQINTGSYIEVKEIVGSFDFSESTTVSLRDTVAQAISNETWSTTSAPGSEIGTARVKAVEFVSGTPGTADSRYHLYLYDILMDSGKSFEDVRSIYDSATPNRFADIVLSTTGNAVLKEQTFNKAIFKLPYTNLKELRDSSGNVETGFRFRKEFSVTFTDGIATISSTDSNETFVGTGVLSTTQKNQNYKVVVNNSGANVTSISLTGTLSVGAGSGSVTGSGSSFTTQLNVGDVLAVNSEQVTVSSITNDTSLTLTGNHTGGASGASFTKILPTGKSLNLSGNGGDGATRTVNVSSPGTIQIDVKEPVTFTAKVIATMDRANARETNKVLTYQRNTHINPSTSPYSSTSEPYGLGYADIYQLHAVYQSPDFSTPANTSSTNVTSDYTLDNGQRDNSYEHGRIVPNVGVAPTGRLLAVFDHFSHSTTQGLGYLSVDSYPVNDTTTSTTTISTANIPTYTSVSTGTKFNLRDCIDFRPIKSANTAGINPAITDEDSGAYAIPTGGLHHPTPGSDFDADLIHYKGRVSKLFLDGQGNFGVNDGSPGYPKPIAPQSIPDTLDIAEIDVPAFPSQPKDVGIKLFKNKRFRMGDIAKLEERVNKLEFLTALSELEREASSKTILDNDGLDRFKNGILVDPFTGFNIADVNNTTYQASIDRKEKTLSAYATKDRQYPLSFLTTGSSNVTRYPGNKLMLTPSSLEIFQSQPFASASINLAQELTFTFVGDLQTFPTTDNWVNTVNDPDNNFVVDFAQLNDNWRSLANAWNVEGNPIQQFWSGTPATSQEVLATQGGVTTGQVGADIFTVTRTATTTTQELSFQRAGINPDTDGPESTEVDRVVDVSVSFEMRTRDFIFNSTGLKDGSPIFAFFDEVNVTSNCKQIELVGSTTIQDLFDTLDADGLLPTDTSKFRVLSTGSLRADNGEILGVFTVPANTFRTGQREFKLTDSSTNTNSDTSTFAKTSILSSGLSLVKSRDIINSRPIDVSFDDANLRTSVGRQTRSLQFTDSRVKTGVVPPPRRSDPLAQSFYVDEATYLNGIFLTSIDVYFKAKSLDSNLGVVMQIREMDFGFPTEKVIGGSSIRVKNSDINISSTSSDATTFTFESPVYLLPGRNYSFCLKPDANSTDFQVWTAEIGGLDITNSDSPVRIDKQPAAGVLFTSSDDYTWSPRQNQDLKFTMRIAKYSTTALGTALFENKSFSGTNYPYSAFTVNAEDVQIPSTNITYESRNADSSFAVGSFFRIDNRERIQETSMKQFSNTSVETTNGFKSFNLKAFLSTGDTYITPYIDLERIHTILEDIQINNSVSNTLTGTVTYSGGSNIVTGAGTLFNNEVQPGEYIKFDSSQFRQVTSISNNTSLTVKNNFTTSNGVSQSISRQNEENPTGPYISESRYITRRVTLNDGFEAEDLVVYLDTNRPAGTDIKVYYKVLNESDTENFDDKFYIEMSLNGTKRFSEDKELFTEEKYVIPTSSKTGGTTLLSGNVAINGTVTVSGTGTAFFEQLKIGDTIQVGTAREERVVATINNNTSLTVTTAFGSTASAQDAFKSLNDTVQYTRPDGSTYTGFKQFAIKVVFISDNESKTTKVKNLRAMALA